VVDGVVKNITDYGAFVDLGGIDGLLHVTDMAWRRVNHPTGVLSIGQTVKVQIIRINQETHRISLGMKQLSPIRGGIEAKYPIGAKFTGRVTNITDYGAFVELEPGIEGLIHVSEMSWTKKNVHPGKIVSTSQEVEVMVLEVDPAKRRISLGLKQTWPTRGKPSREAIPVGSTVEGEVKNKTEFGLFIGLDGDVDGMVHLSDLDWNRRASRSSKSTRRATWSRRRCSTSTSRRSASRSASSSSRGGRRRRRVRRTAQEGRRRHLRSDRGQGWRHRSEDRRHRHRNLHQARRPQRATVTSSAPSASPSARRSMPASSSSTRRPARSGVDQGARNRRREGSRRAVRLVRFGRFARRHPRRRAQEAGVSTTLRNSSHEKSHPV
jgi:predicted RNA-binding protein with RPS1 domain